MILKSILLLIIAVGTPWLTMGQAMDSGRMAIPGVQHIMTEYGKQLNLTDEQKAEMAALSLDYRRGMQRMALQVDGRHWRGDRRSYRRARGVEPRGEFRGRRDAGEARSRWERRDEDVQAFRRDSLYLKIHEVLDEEQSETLKTMLTERAERQHEYRALRHEQLIERAGIEGEKATQVKAILDRRSESRHELALNRIQNPGEFDRDEARETFRDMWEIREELGEILTANEYRELQRVMNPRAAQARRLHRW